MIGKIIHKGRNIPGPVRRDKAKGVDIGGNPVHFLRKPLEGIWRDKIIAVQEKQIIPLGRFNAGIAGSAQAAVFLMDHPAMVLPGQLVAHGGAVIRGAVVHQNQLIVPAGLGNHGGYAGFQIVLYVIYGNDHRKSHRRVSSLLG